MFIKELEASKVADHKYHLEGESNNHCVAQSAHAPAHFGQTLGAPIELRNHYVTWKLRNASKNLL